MNIAGVARRVRNIANALTKPTQANVTHEPWISQSKTAKPTYDTGVLILALIEQGPKVFRTALGEVIEVKAILHFLRPIAANGATGRNEPIDPRDRITLPNGAVGAPIIGAGGMVDPATGYPYFLTVGLG